MILFHPVLIIFYCLLALGGLLYLFFKLSKRAIQSISGKKQPKGWLQDELDTFKSKK
jgi:heme/copper-type cytochrome/quinol oxidase subunit 1